MCEDKLDGTKLLEFVDFVPDCSASEWVDNILDRKVH